MLSVRAAPEHDDARRARLYLESTALEAQPSCSRAIWVLDCFAVTAKNQWVQVLVIVDIHTRQWIDACTAGGRRLWVDHPNGSARDGSVQAQAHEGGARPRILLGRAVRVAVPLMPAKSPRIQVSDK